MVGLTCATQTDLSARPTGYHIAVEHICPMVSSLPSEPEGVPFDLWSAGLCKSRLLEPRLTQDKAGGATVLVCPFVKAVPDSEGKARAEPAA